MKKIGGGQQLASPKKSSATQDSARGGPPSARGPRPSDGSLSARQRQQQEQQQPIAFGSRAPVSARASAAPPAPAAGRRPKRPLGPEPVPPNRGKLRSSGGHSTAGSKPSPSQASSTTQEHLTAGASSQESSDELIKAQQGRRRHHVVRTSVDQQLAHPQVPTPGNKPSTAVPSLDLGRLNSKPAAAQAGSTGSRPVPKLALDRLTSPTAAHEPSQGASNKQKGHQPTAPPTKASARRRSSSGKLLSARQGQGSARGDNSRRSARSRGSATERSARPSAGRQAATARERTDGMRTARVHPSPPMTTRDRFGNSLLPGDDSRPSARLQGTCMTTWANSPREKSALSSRRRTPQKSPLKLWGDRPMATERSPLQRINSDWVRIGRGSPRGEMDPPNSAREYVAATAHKGGASTRYAAEDSNSGQSSSSEDETDELHCSQDQAPAAASSQPQHAVQAAAGGPDAVKAGPVGQGARQATPGFLMARTAPALSPLGASTSFNTTPGSHNLSGTPPFASHSGQAQDHPHRHPSPPSIHRDAPSSEHRSTGSKGSASPRSSQRRVSYPDMPIDDVMRGLLDDDVVMGGSTIFGGGASREGSPEVVSAEAVQGLAAEAVQSPPAATHEGVAVEAGDRHVMEAELPTPKRQRFSPELSPSRQADSAHAAADSAHADADSAPLPSAILPTAARSPAADSAASTEPQFAFGSVIGSMAQQQDSVLPVRQGDESDSGSEPGDEYHTPLAERGSQRSFAETPFYSPAFSFGSFQHSPRDVTRARQHFTFSAGVVDAESGAESITGSYEGMRVRQLGLFDSLDSVAEDSAAAAEQLGDESAVLPDAAQQRHVTEQELPVLQQQDESAAASPEADTEQPSDLLPDSGGDLHSVYASDVLQPPMGDMTADAAPAVAEHPASVPATDESSSVAAVPAATHAAVHQAAPLLATDPLLGFGSIITSPSLESTLHMDQQQHADSSEPLTAATQQQTTGTINEWGMTSQQQAPIYPQAASAAAGTWINPLFDSQEQASAIQAVPSAGAALPVGQPPLSPLQRLTALAPQAVQDAGVTNPADATGAAVSGADQQQDGQAAASGTVTSLGGTAGRTPGPAITSFGSPVEDEPLHKRFTPPLQDLLQPRRSLSQTPRSSLSSLPASPTIRHSLCEMGSEQNAGHESVDVADDSRAVQDESADVAHDSWGVQDESAAAESAALADEALAGWAEADAQQAVGLDPADQGVEAADMPEGPALFNTDILFEDEDGEDELASVSSQQQLHPAPAGLLVSSSQEAARQLPAAQEPGALQDLQEQYGHAWVQNNMHLLMQYSFRQLLFDQHSLVLLPKEGVVPLAPLPTGPSSFTAAGSGFPGAWQQLPSSQQQLPGSPAHSFSASHQGGLYEMTPPPMHPGMAASAESATAQSSSRSYPQPSYDSAPADSAGWGDGYIPPADQQPVMLYGQADTAPYNPLTGWPGPGLQLQAASANSPPAAPSAVHDDSYWAPDWAPEAPVQHVPSPAVPAQEAAASAEVLVIHPQAADHMTGQQNTFEPVAPDNQLAEAYDEAAGMQPGSAHVLHESAQAVEQPAADAMHAFAGAPESMQAASWLDSNMALQQGEAAAAAPEATCSRGAITAHAAALPEPTEVLQADLQEESRWAGAHVEAIQNDAEAAVFSTASLAPEAESAEDRQYMKLVTSEMQHLCCGPPNPDTADEHTTHARVQPATASVTCSQASVPALEPIAESSEEAGGSQGEASPVGPVASPAQGLPDSPAIGYATPQAPAAAASFSLPGFATPATPSFFSAASYQVGTPLGTQPTPTSKRVSSSPASSMQLPSSAQQQAETAADVTAQPAEAVKEVAVQLPANNAQHTSSEGGKDAADDAGAMPMEGYQQMSAAPAEQMPADMVQPAELMAADIHQPAEVNLTEDAHAAEAEGKISQRGEVLAETQHAPFESRQWPAEEAVQLASADVTQADSTELLAAEAMTEAEPAVPIALPGAEQHTAEGTSAADESALIPHQQRAQFPQELAPADESAAPESAVPADESAHDSASLSQQAAADVRDSDHQIASAHAERADAVQQWVHAAVEQVHADSPSQLAEDSHPDELFHASPPPAAESATPAAESAQLNDESQQPDAESEQGLTPAAESPLMQALTPSPMSYQPIIPLSQASHSHDMLSDWDMTPAPAEISAALAAAAAAAAESPAEAAAEASADAGALAEELSSPVLPEGSSSAAADSSAETAPEQAAAEGLQAAEEASASSADSQGAAASTPAASGSSQQAPFATPAFDGFDLVTYGLQRPYELMTPTLVANFEADCEAGTPPEAAFAAFTAAAAAAAAAATPAASQGAANSSTHPSPVLQAAGQLLPTPPLFLHPAAAARIAATALVAAPPRDALEAASPADSVEGPLHYTPEQQIPGPLGSIPVATPVQPAVGHGPANEGRAICPPALQQANIAFGLPALSQGHEQPQALSQLMYSIVEGQYDSPGLSTAPGGGQTSGGAGEARFSTPVQELMRGGLPQPRPHSRRSCLPTTGRGVARQPSRLAQRSAAAALPSSPDAAGSPAYEGESESLHDDITDSEASQGQQELREAVQAAASTDLDEASPALRPHMQDWGEAAERTGPPTWIREETPFFTPQGEAASPASFQDTPVHRFTPTSAPEAASPAAPGAESPAPVAESLAPAVTPARTPASAAAAAALQARLGSPAGLQSHVLDWESLLSATPSPGNIPPSPAGSCFSPGMATSLLALADRLQLMRRGVLQVAAETSDLSSPEGRTAHRLLGEASAGAASSRLTSRTHADSDQEHQDLGDTIRNLDDSMQHQQLAAGQPRESQDLDSFADQLQQSEIDVVAEQVPSQDDESALSANASAGQGRESTADTAADLADSSPAITSHDAAVQTDYVSDVQSEGEAAATDEAAEDEHMIAGHALTDFGSGELVSDEEWVDADGREVESSFQDASSNVCSSRSGSQSFRSASSEEPAAATLIPAHRGVQADTGSAAAAAVPAAPFIPPLVLNAISQPPHTPVQPLDAAQGVRNIRRLQAASRHLLLGSPQPQAPSSAPPAPSQSRTAGNAETEHESGLSSRDHVTARGRVTARGSVTARDAELSKEWLPFGPAGQPRTTQDAMGASTARQLQDKRWLRLAGYKTTRERHA